MITTCVEWMSEPDGVGTSGLLYSCMFTLFLSTGTAYHPDVGDGGIVQSKSSFRSNLLMATLFMVGREYMVWVAVEDLLRANEVQSTYTNWDVEEVSLPVFLISLLNSDLAPIADPRNVDQLLHQVPSRFQAAETGFSGNRLSMT